MKKDKKWLKEELDKLTTDFNSRELSRYEMGRLDGYTHASMLLDQLDEPELTQHQVDKWLDERDMVAVDTMMVHQMGMQNKVVIEKPVIPQFVADWIDMHNLHGNNPLREYRDLEVDFNEGWTDEEDAAVYHWANKNPYAFIDALRHGYEVEKEPVYYAKIKGHELVETEVILDDDTGNDVSEFHRNIYFVLQRNGELVIDMKDSGLSGARHFMTMTQWNNLGINETNADFEELIVSHR